MHKTTTLRCFTVLFTGLSGAGKTTVSNLVAARLYKAGIRTYSLDGDVLRSGLSADLGYTTKDRTENLRRAAELAKLMQESGNLVLASFIAPTVKSRTQFKEIVDAKNFMEVYIDTPIEICEQRDIKGLYKKARKGEILNFTGISQDYEPPTNPDLILSHLLPLETAVAKVCLSIQEKIFLPKADQYNFKATH